MKISRPIGAVLVAMFVACAVHPARADQLPEPLILQIQHLAKTFGDAYASEDIEGRMIQRIGPGPDGERVLVVFGVNGFRGGPRTMQYLALFVEGNAERDEKHYRLIDVLPIGGRSWREIAALDAAVKKGAAPADLTIALKAVEKPKSADSNVRAKITMVQLEFKDGRLVETGKRAESRSTRGKSAQPTPLPPKR